LLQIAGAFSARGRVEDDEDFIHASHLGKVA